MRTGKERERQSGGMKSGKGQKVRVEPTAATEDQQTRDMGRTLHQTSSQGAPHTAQTHTRHKHHTHKHTHKRRLIQDLTRFYLISQWIPLSKQTNKNINEFYESVVTDKT